MVSKSSGIGSWSVLSLLPPGNDFEALGNITANLEIKNRMLVT